MWLTSLKIAIIEKNTDSLDMLMNDIPELSDAKDIEQAIYLLREATEMLHTLQDETKISMGKIKKNIAFLRSTERQKINKLDIKL
ncbi:hypothetical protein SMGD1_1034 [Sulfurimonas gotlandica GD1]|uniref:Uncharacterized protein n=1 Tax=Sulfurimonas gotlandica (strain DSM 19862 / JCM 16533 / GD1) TaxID=929558 RepID=B6BGD1_SULGG|nr:hypothetical protein [Sulfurimonas gotlandica]EDZ63046.1 conserved hypothetical protein [Sulfurimonas gotlandica GD1]EHP29558.1 hypothetical protein SMGD1_1034 [Sulfurimonas gotlandica GD1]